MKNDNWLYLSYLISENLSAYGNGQRVIKEYASSIKSGDITNNSMFKMSSHFGTHVDFPKHFLDSGKTSDQYVPSFFIFSNVGIIVINNLITYPLLSVNDLLVDCNKTNKNIDCLIIKTGFCYKRFKDSYWNDNLGFNSGVADYLINIFPNLKAVGFDLISITCSHYREIGRMVHREFLSREIILIEDMNLCELDRNSKIIEMIVSPLRIDKMEASPVTVFAKLNS